MDNHERSKLLKQYLAHCRFEKGLDEKTIKAYRIDLAQFHNYIDFLGGAYDKENVQSYIASLYGNYAVKSVKRKIASIKAFFNYLEYEEILEANPFSKIRANLHEPFVLPRTIPLATINLLLQCAYQQVSITKVASPQYHAALRNVAVLELLFATGIRISELCSLRKSEVNLVDGSIKIYGKGAKERLVQIGNQDVLATMAAYYRDFSVKIEETGWFFVNRCGNRLSDQSVRIMIRNYCRAAGIRLHITPHMFRHSFATLLLEEDVDIRYIQQLLGHSSITTTQIYTHVTSKKQRDILISKHPRNKLELSK